MKAYPTYKDSGIDWLGEVPQHWEKYRTPSILKVISKAGTDSDELLSVYLDRGVIRHSDSGGMQVHKPSKDMSAYQKVLPGNFVCNNQQAWRGSVGVSEYEGRISPAYIIFKLSSKLVPQFANYFFRSQAWNPSFVYSSKGVGSIQRNLYLPWLRQHYCYLPTTEEQQSIVAYLDKKCAEIDELVTRRQAIIERLKELKQSIIADAVTKGLNPDVPMMDSGIDWLGEVPQHWEKYRTPSILKVTSKAGTDSDELLSVYLDRGVIRHSESDGMQVHKPSKDMSSYQKVLPGNFVCNNQQAWRGSVGVSEHEGRISPAYIIFNLSSKLVPKFANYFFRSQAWNPSFVYSSKGVGSIQRNLYLPWLRQHYCYLPSTEEQQAIVAYLDKKCAEIDELVVRQEQIIEKLKELKTATIAHVVTGKVDVRDAI